ncbi:hypothetical protein ACFWZ2_03500 [Streptomyces sp. NPDC059002]|uniref:hypothetical protein n=1 Tax=Streptomyces sp. NPDC059002 TaxID=3346690 RepID=UPI0036839732
MAQTAAASPARNRTGIIADGVVKVVLAAVCTIGAAPLGRLLGVPEWLMVASGVALLIGGGIELGYMRSRTVPTYTRLMIAYDSGWALTALTGLLLAWRSGDADTAGGEIWIGYQTVAPLVFAALLAAARPRA